tara:strand:+ start:223 stop:459 length:237 start_codon:yes stop_codon:yes gene_type:complete
MPTFRVKYGEVFEFEGQGPEEVVPILSSKHVAGTLDEVDFMKRSAMEMCEWNGKDYYYNSRELFAKSMIKNGLLEYVD